MERGLDGTKLTFCRRAASLRLRPRRPRLRRPPRLRGRASWRALVQVLSELEESLQILERRGLNLADVPGAEAGARGLPIVPRAAGRPRGVVPHAGRGGRLPPGGAGAARPRTGGGATRPPATQRQRPRQRPRRDVLRAGAARGARRQPRPGASCASSAWGRRTWCRRRASPAASRRRAYVLENGDQAGILATAARAGRRGAQARRARPDDHALQGPGRDGPRGAVGDDARPGEADAAARCSSTTPSRRTRCSAR